MDFPADLDPNAVGAWVTNDPRYIAARAEMAGRVRAFDRKMIDDPNISDDDYNQRSGNFSYEQCKQLFRDTQYLYPEAHAALRQQR